MFLSLGVLLGALTGPFTVGCSESVREEEPASVIKLGFFTRGDNGFNDDANVALVYLALREINQAGGLHIDGKTYTLDLETAEFTDPTPGEASAVFDELIADGVKAVLGPPWSSHILDSAGEEDGVWRRARATETVLISESATSSLISELDDDGYVFRMMPPDRVQGKIAAREAFDRGFRRVAILRRDDAYGFGLAEQFTLEFEALGGAVAAEQAYDTTGELIPDLQSHNYSAELDAVFASEPDLVYLLAFDEALRISQRVAERQDLAAPGRESLQFLAADGLYDIGILQGCAPTVVERFIGTTPGVDDASTSYREFKATLAKEGLGSPWNSSAELYDAAYLVALAMQAAGSYQSSAFRGKIAEVSRVDEGDVVVYQNDFARAREALLNGDGVNYEGASGPIELNDAGDPTSGTYLVWRVRITQAEGVTLVTEKVIPFDQ